MPKGGIWWDIVGYKKKGGLYMEIKGIVTTTVLILALITISTTTAAAISCDGGDICVNETGWWNNGSAFNASGTPIQAAVDNASSGETIYVWNGSYSENVDIATSHLTLRGEGADVVTVTAEDSSDHVFEVTADYVDISGFTATGATSYPGAGIYLGGVDNCNISENNAFYNFIGIMLIESSNNTLTGNTAVYNEYGIGLLESSNNTLAGNIAGGNNVGIGLESSSNNLIYNNYFENTANAWDNGNNQWNITKTAGTNIIGGPFLGGNHWKDYAGDDTDGDGLGDTLLPYNSSGGIQNGGDYHPLVVPCSDTTPPDPVNLANTTGGGYFGYWVNYTWSAGTGNVTDSYNVSLNGTWTNGTTSTFMNVSMSPCEWANITVLAYNTSCTGTLSEGSVSDEVQAPCDTTPPVITITTPEPYGLYTVGMTLIFSATDDLSGVATVVGNLTNTSDVSQNVVSGFAPAVGVYTLVVTATDNAGNTNVSDPVFFVVYDTDGGHATGGGWFYPDGDSTLPDGKANFGFTARYKNDVSTGKLNFQYIDAGIHLKSTSIDWLTISAVSAQFQGTGTINGDGLYTFRVKAKDNGEPGAGVDHFDIMIWNDTDTEADPYHKAKNIISGGNIQVQTN